MVQEHAVRRGMTWPQVRRALSVERARRLEDREERSISGWGSRSILAFAIWAFVFLAVIQSDRGQAANSVANYALLGLGLFGCI
jgi:hypothetical protein